MFDFHEIRYREPKNLCFLAKKEGVLFGSLQGKFVPLRFPSTPPSSKMKKLTPDILIEAFGLQLDEVSKIGSKEELEAVTKYAHRVIVQQVAPRLLEKEQEAMAQIAERQKKMQSSENKGLINLFSGPMAQAIGTAMKVETKNEDYGTRTQE